MEIKDRFLNFPIILLRDFLDDHNACIIKIFQYSVFEMVYSDSAKFESIEEFMEEFEFPINKDFIPSVKRDGEILYNSCIGMNYPHTGIHIDTISKFNAERSPFDLVCLLLFLALKSIVQKKPFCNAKNPLILARMSGFPKADENIPDSILYWMKSESRRRKVFTELEKHYKVVRAYKSRGITFSINKLSQEELEFAILKQKELKEDRLASARKQHAKNEAKRKFEEWKRKRRNEGI